MTTHLATIRTAVNIAAVGARVGSRHGDAVCGSDGMDVMWTLEKFNECIPIERRCAACSLIAFTDSEAVVQTQSDLREELLKVRDRHG